MEIYLALQIDMHKDNSFTVSQPLLVDRIITESILTKDTQGKPRKKEWNYISLIGMLNYLVNCTQLDLAYSVHQCARFCEEPKYIHEQAVKRIIRYLLYLKRHNKLGITYGPNILKSIVVYVDASFAGEWNNTWSDEPSSVISRTGYMILYAGCPIIWCSKLQTEIALSTTESEYIAFFPNL